MIFFFLEICHKLQLSFLTTGISNIIRFSGWQGPRDRTSYIIVWICSRPFSKLEAFFILYGKWVSVVFASMRYATFRLMRATQWCSLFLAVAVLRENNLPLTFRECSIRPWTIGALQTSLIYKPLHLCRFVTYHTTGAFVNLNCIRYFCSSVLVGMVFLIGFYVYSESM